MGSFIHQRVSAGSRDLAVSGSGVTVIINPPGIVSRTAAVSSGTAERLSIRGEVRAGERDTGERDKDDKEDKERGDIKDTAASNARPDRWFPS